MHDSYLIYDIFIMFCLLALCALPVCAHVDGFRMTEKGQREDPGD